MLIQEIQPKIDESWKNVLKEDFESPYFLELKKFLVQEKCSGVPVYPPGPQIFSAFDHTPFDKIKVVILGQDPYHGTGQAHGLAFSVPEGVKPPPSLVNIFKEIKDDLGIPIPQSGNLIRWAEQGVLLLNATLTVKAGIPCSHQNKGWERFTDSAIRKISELHSGIVFLLWGNFAKAKESLIDANKHFVLKAAHPSPFSAANGFFGCRHFSRTNELLKRAGKKEISW